MNKNEFIPTIAPLVVAENQRRGNPLFSSVVIAQAICESGWGQSKIMMKANAIFGIKATSSWKGKVYNANTQECYDGSTYTKITACFRAYNSLAESISDYFDLITKLERYRKACVSNSPLECITAIKNGGYATSPTYINTIMSIINSNNLTKYDVVEDVENSVDNSKSIEELAKEVIAGKYGNGEERKQKLGNLYNEVQKKVNEILNVNTNSEKIYIVKKGDCLCNIAKKFNTTVEKIAKDNNITNVNLIYVNQKLIIR
jgi:LysM repeat protein